MTVSFRRVSPLPSGLSQFRDIRGVSGVPRITRMIRLDQFFLFWLPAFQTAHVAAAFQTLQSTPPHFGLTFIGCHPRPVAGLDRFPFGCQIVAG